MNISDIKSHIQKSEEVYIQYVHITYTDALSHVIITKNINVSQSYWLGDSGQNFGLTIDANSGFRISFKNTKDLRICISGSMELTLWHPDRRGPLRQAEVVEAAMNADLGQATQGKSSTRMSSGSQFGLERRGESLWQTAADGKALCLAASMAQQIQMLKKAREKLKLLLSWHLLTQLQERGLVPASEKNVMLKHKV